MIEDNNFYRSVLMSRIIALVGGAGLEAAERWLQTPHKDFNFRTPESFLNAAEWMTVRDWLVDNVSGQFYNDVDYYAVAQNSEQYTTSLVTGEGMDAFEDLRNRHIIATGGTRSVLNFHQSKPKTNASYIIHTFTSSGTFRVERGGRIEFIIVGGGGGGGAGSASHAGGGGGGGEVIIGSTVITANPYNIVVGAGGAAGNDIGDARVNTNGGDSIAFGFTAFGGGAGGTAITVMNTGVARTDATGGGGSSQTGSTAGAVGINGRGFAGGNGMTAFPGGGGGGGAGGAGVAATGTNAGNGGIGKSNRIVGILPIPYSGGGENDFFTGTEIFYGGGGGGGACGPGPSSAPILGGVGGRGGGGSAPNSNNQGAGAAGQANTGGGGAGGSGNFVGGAGGSGIVIIRYLVGI